MILEWSDQAVEDMVQINRYYSQLSTAAASDLVERIISRCTELIQFPYQGRVQPEISRDDVRFIIVDRYRITYQILNISIQIQTVFDCRQDSSKEK